MTSLALLANHGSNTVHAAPPTELCNTTWFTSSTPAPLIDVTVSLILQQLPAIQQLLWLTSQQFIPMTTSTPTTTPLSSTTTSSMSEQLVAVQHRCKTIQRKHKQVQSLLNQAQRLYQMGQERNDFLQSRVHVLEKKIQDMESSVSGKYTCIICNSNEFDTTLSKCGHVFCNSCLQQWRKTSQPRTAHKTHGSVSCPVCKQRSKLLRLYSSSTS